MRNREMIHIHFKHTLFRYIYLYTQLVNKVSKNGSLLPVLCSLPFLIKQFGRVISWVFSLHTFRELKGWVKQSSTQELAGITHDPIDQ